MKILSDFLEFDWDKGNVEKNQRKHNVTVKETEEVFVNDPKFVFEDQKHSETEERYGLFGHTDRDRKLAIVFTVRKEKIRVVTVRDMSRKERRSHEKIKNDSKI